MAAQGNALVQLAKRVGLQQLSQLRLAHQNNLKQFAGGGFHIGEQPQLLQHIGAQVLGFVHEQDHALALGFFLQEKGIEAIDEGFYRFCVRGDAEFVVDGFEQLKGVELGVEDVGRCGILVQAFQEHATKGRLAGTHFAGDLNESLAIAHGIVQVGQHLFMNPGQVKVLRVGYQFERSLLKAKKTIVHGRMPIIS